MVEKIDPNESKLFDDLQQLCILCTEALVKISDNTKYPPKFVTQMFLNIMQGVLDKID